MAILAGPDFKKDFIIENEKIINIGPTIDKVYDLELSYMVGRPIDCIK